VVIKCVHLGVSVIVKLLSLFSLFLLLLLLIIIRLKIMIRERYRDNVTGALYT